MDVVVYLILLAIWGLVVGLFARLALPGKDPMPVWQTIAVGIGGSALAAIVSLFLFGQLGGFLLCLVFSALILYFIRRSRGGGLTEPGTATNRRQGGI